METQRVPAACTAHDGICHVSCRNVGPVSNLFCKLVQDREGFIGCLVGSREEHQHPIAIQPLHRIVTLAGDCHVVFKFLRMSTQLIGMVFCFAARLANGAVSREVRLELETVNRLLTSLGPDPRPRSLRG